jgi:sugar O-acyltransferase (sialic acid O-acetyltransferase NeuD family)
MTKNIILIGAGGHANSCINTIVSSKKFIISYLVNMSSDKKTNSTEFKTISEKVFLKKKLEGKNILIALGQLKTGELREDKFNFFKKRKCIFPVVKSNHSLISDNTKIKEGTIIMHYVIVNRNVSIGKNCIINNRVTIEHDCIIEDNVHIAPGAIILGGCHIKKNSFIGSGSIIKQCSVLKRNSIIPTKIYFK